VSPDELIRQYGADTVRVYTLFLGPPEKDVEWNDQGIEGAARFLRRIWRRFYDTRELLAAARGLPCVLPEMDAPARDLYRTLHETIAQITRDMEGDFHFNTAVARIMELLNAIEAFKVDLQSSASTRAVYRATIEALVLVLSPFAPHLCEELWRELGHAGSILRAAWPAVDEAALARDTVEIVVQLNGKVRSRMVMPSGLDAKAAEAYVLAQESTRALLAGKTVRKAIVVPGRLVNLVVG